MIEIQVSERDGNTVVRVPGLKCALHIGPDGIGGAIDGYGDKYSADEHGAPVLIDLAKTETQGPRVLVWADINDEDPTHIVSLEGAMESRRKED